MGWMVRLKPRVRFLTPEKYLKQRKAPDSARTSELDFVCGEVHYVVSMSTKYRLTRCTEAHWMAVVVHPLLKIPRRLKKYRNIRFEMLVVADL